MADAPAAVVAPAAAPAALPAPVVTPVAETPAPEAFVDPVEGFLARAAAEAEGEETTETEGAPKPEGEAAAADPKADPKAAAQALAAADDALFSEKALATPAGVKAAAARLRELRGEATATLAKAEKKQRENDRDFLVLKKRERTFGKTKDDHLSWFSRVRDEAKMNGAHLDVIGTTEDPARLLDSLGFLCRRDGRAMYELIVTGGAKLRKAPSPEIEELRRDQRTLREELQLERDAAKEAAERRQRAETVQRREGEILTAAKDAKAYPTLAQYVAVRPREVLEEVVALKGTHKKTYGTALTDAEAMVQLDQQLALLLSGQRGGAGNPRPEEGLNPGGQSGQSNPARQPSLVAGIPPSASTRVPALRESTDEEQRQELTYEYYQSIGLG